MGIGAAVESEPMRRAEGQCLRERLLECPPPAWRGAEKWEDPRDAEKCGEEKCDDETRGLEKWEDPRGAEKCGEEKCEDEMRGAAKCDTGAGVRTDGAALRKLEAIPWGIALG